MTELAAEAVLADPEGVLRRLRTQHHDLERDLAIVQQRIEVASRLTRAAAEWRQLTTGHDDGDAPHAGQRQPVPPAPTDPAQPPEDADPTAGQPAPRRVLVANLLGQDPARVWRVSEVGQALGLDNTKSLGVLMAEMADRGALVKTGSGCYQAPPPTTAPASG